MSDLCMQTQKHNKCFLNQHNLQDYVVSAKFIELTKKWHWRNTTILKVKTMEEAKP